MTSRLIELEDGTLIEVSVSGTHVEEISGDLVSKVNSSLYKIKPIIVNVVRPIFAAWNEINQDMLVEKAEVEIGLSFESEGNIFVTKAKAGANITVTLTLKPVNKGFTVGQSLEN